MTTKIKLELLTQFRGDTNFLGKPQVFGCSKETPSRLGAQSTKINKHETYQPSEERGALETGQFFTSTLQALALNPSLNPQQPHQTKAKGSNEGSEWVLSCCRSRWEKESERKGLRELLYPLTQKRAVTALRPEICCKTPEAPGSSETPGKPRKLRPPKVSTQKVNPVNVLVQRCLS
jgi:hypothetical protein